MRTRGADVSARKRRTPPPRLALSVLEAAESLDMSHDAFKRHVAGDLRWVRKGAMRRVAVTELQRWLDQNQERLPVAELAAGDNHDERGSR
jgi:hypothetical protein